MIVANEKNMFYRAVHGKKMNKNEIFDDLVRGSKGFMTGGKGIEMQGNLQNTSHFGFYMKDYWQGSYDKYIKVSWPWIKAVSSFFYFVEESS